MRLVSLSLIYIYIILPPAVHNIIIINLIRSIQIFTVFSLIDNQSQVKAFRLRVVAFILLLRIQERTLLVKSQSRITTKPTSLIRLQYMPKGVRLN